MQVITIHRKSSKDRVHRLEEQIGDLYDIVQCEHLTLVTDRHTNRSGRTLSNRSPPQRSVHINPELDSSVASHVESSPLAHSTSRHRDSFAPSRSAHLIDYLTLLTNSSPEPMRHVLEHFVNIYIERAHLQPLPLFDPENLLDHLSAGPNYLLWSFMALVLHFGAHSFYSGCEGQAVSFYTRSGNNSVTKLAADGVAKTEMLQAICLLALRNILCTYLTDMRDLIAVNEDLAGELNKAWMLIGCAGRLFLLRKQSIGELDPPQEEDLSRCFWSIFALECTFSSNAAQLSHIDSPRPPLSAHLPPPIVASRNGTYSPDFFDDNNTVKDLGINHYYLELVKVWGNLLNFMQELRNGKVEDSWTAESTYTRLTVVMYERDTQLCTKHLLRHANFGSRTKEDLSVHRQYWHPWLAMQLFSHAIPAILNHPFIHLSALRDSASGAARSRFFLQQTVDTALLHSAWVARLLRMCDELGFVIQNPLIGDVVASTATVSWLFQFTGDTKTRSAATENFETFQAVLSRLAVSWQHLSPKVSFCLVLVSCPSAAANMLVG